MVEMIKEFEFNNGTDNYILFNFGDSNDVIHMLRKGNHLFDVELTTLDCSIEGYALLLSEMYEADVKEIICPYEDYIDLIKNELETNFENYCISKEVYDKIKSAKFTLEK